MIEREKINWIIAITCFLALSLFMFRVPLLVTDPYYFEMSADLQIPIRRENFFGYLYPMWNYLGVSSMTKFGHAMYFLFYVFTSPFQLNSMSMAEIIWVVSQFLAGLSMFSLTRCILERNYRNGSTNAVFLASMTSGLLYMFNSFVGLQVRHQDMRLQYALTPLVFLMFIMAFEKGGYGHIVAASFLWMLSGIECRSIVFSYIFFAISFLYFLFVSSSRMGQFMPKLRKGVKTAVLLVIFYILFSSHWLVPQVLSSFSSGPPEPGYLITVEMLEDNSRIKFLDAIRGLDWKFVYLYTPPPSPILKEPLVNALLTILTFILPIFVYLVLLLRPNNKDSLFFSIFLILFTILATGTAYPFTGDFYLWLMYQAPFHNWYGWAFRVIRRMLEFSFFFMSILIGLSTCGIVSWISKSDTLKTTFKGRSLRIHLSISLTMALILSSIILPSWPLLTGDFNGELKPFKVPMEYYTVNKWLEDQEGDFKVMWVPKYMGEEHPVWLKDGWYRGALKWLDFQSSSKPTYGRLMQHRARQTDVFHNYMGEAFEVFDIMQANKTDRLGRLLAPLSVKYLIFHDDVTGREEENLSILNFLKSQKDLKLVKNEGILYVFENENEFSPVYVPQQVVLTSKGLNTLSTLISIENFGSTAMPIQFLTQTLFENKDYFHTSNAIIVWESYLDLLPQLVEESYLISPFDYTNHYNPGWVWSKARISDPPNGKWHPYLNLYNIDNWDFDYNKGIAFTLANNTALNMNFKIKQAGEHVLFIRYFKNSDGGQVTVYLDGKMSWNINTKSQVSKFVWKELSSVNLAEGEHVLTLENVEGFNAVNLFVLMSKEEMRRYDQEVYELLEKRRVIHVFEPEFDLYYENSVITEEFGGEASNGKVLKIEEDGRAWTPIEIQRNGNYTLALRMMYGENYGNLVIQIDNRTYETPQGIGNGLDWLYIHDIQLERGFYNVSLHPKLPSIEMESPAIDLMLLYSTESSETPEDVFAPREAPARVIENKKIDLTRRIVRVEAKKPFMLAFAEQYDPLWTATVDGEEIRSIPLYSIINGFWINRTGKLEITIEFQPQRWFYYGLTITLTSLIDSFAYLAWSWSRRTDLKSRLIKKRISNKNAIKKGGHL